MNGPPTAGEPAWVADPTARHQLRWWDGTRFTDQVADAGAMTTDPFVGGTMPPVTPLPPAPPAKASRLPVILAAVGAFVVVLALLTLLAGDDGGPSGTGEFAGEVDDGDEARHRFSIGAGTALLVVVEPDDDFDVVVGFALDGAAGDEVEDLFEDTPIAGLAAEDGNVVFRRDIGFEGDEELTFLAVPFDVEGEVVVSGFEDSEGDYQITIEAVDLELEEDADGDDVLDALQDADGLPRRFREALESLTG